MSPLPRLGSRLLSRKAKPLVPALTGLNHTLASNKHSSVPFQDAAGKTITVLYQTFQGHLQITKKFLKPLDVNLTYCIEVVYSTSTE